MICTDDYSEANATAVDLESFNREDEWVASPSDVADLNLYVYVAGNPVNATDPSGRDLVGLAITMGISSLLGGITTGAYGYAQGWSAQQIAVASGEAALAGLAVGGVFGGIAVGLGAAATSMGASASVGYLATGIIASGISLPLAISDFAAAIEHGNATDKVFAGVNLALTSGDMFLLHFAAARPTFYTSALQLPDRVPSPVQQVGQGVIDWLGQGWRLVRSDRDGLVAIDSKNTKRFRIDFKQSDGDAAHAHLQIKDQASGRWIDAPGTPHRIHFQGGQ